MRICHGTVLSAICILTFPAVVLANPVPVPVPPTEPPDAATLLKVLILFLAEGGLLALYSMNTCLRVLRFVICWLVVTVQTFILFVAALYYLVPREYGMQGQLSFKVVAISGELVVTVVEAIALYYLLRFPWLVRKPEQAPSRITCLMFSFTVNCFSALGGFILTGNFIEKLTLQ